MFGYDGPEGITSTALGGPVVTRPSATISGSPTPLQPAGLGSLTWAALLEAQAATSRSLEAALREGSGMSLTDYEVLLQLSLAEGHRLRMNDLASRCGLSNSGLSRRFDSLVDAEWTRREPCPDDARGTWAVLTRQGISALEEATEHHSVALERAFIRHFDGPELEQLGELLGRLCNGHGSPRHQGPTLV